MCSASAITSPRHGRTCQGTARPRRSAGQDKGAEAAFAASTTRAAAVFQDEYVFVIGLDDGRYRASGSSPNLVGVDAQRHRRRRQAAVQDMIELARKQGSGTVDYVWRNPATNAVEQKHTLIQRVDDVLLGVGYYTRP